ncbi:hypothetical protein QBC38DRAFT_467881 [Podospora fimiseda]|uniref:Pentatricopeptide repeat-containing protein n=1 Tax=Podospora fimiseda TaxID=252190 RepID=A0AAN7H779_9PEZI|nr:hypothetical protein QBC38DRAFT_467881 [Podospora fimiseda]
MRDLGSVCLRCQLKLLVAPGARRRAARPRQQPLRYNSTRTVADDIRPRHNHVYPSSRSTNPRPAPGSGPSPPPTAPPTVSAAERRHKAVEMFKSIVGPAAEPPKRPVEATVDHIELVGRVSQLQSMIGRKDVTNMEAFNFFNEMIYPKIQKLGAETSQTIVGGIGVILLTKLCKEKKQDFDKGELPSLTRLTEIMIELNVLNVTSLPKWGMLIFELAQHICRLDVYPDRYDSIKSYDNAMAHRQNLLQDLLGAWALFAAQKPPEVVPEPVGDGDVNETMQQRPRHFRNFIDADDGGEIMRDPNRRGTLVDVFTETFHQYSPGTMTRISCAAYVTYRMMQDPVNLNPSTEQSAAPFLKVMKEIIPRALPPLPKWYEAELSEYPDLLRYLHRRSGIGSPSKVDGRQTSRPDRTNTFQPGKSIKFENSINRAKGFAPKPVDSNQDADARPQQRAANNLQDNNTRIQNHSGIKAAHPLSQSESNRLHKQLGQAIKQRNISGASKLWAEFWGPKAVPDSPKIKQLQRHAEMFDYFILAFLTMKQPRLAIEVWDKMETIGLKPTIKTWNSMMQGCVVTKSPDGIRTVWDKLTKSGIKLDTPIWTARISGLVNSGDPDGALRALNEMALMWNQRSKPEMVQIAVQPSIEPVNAALSGLFRLGRDEEARRVLNWAGSYHIKPDIVTFNVLLRPLIRRGDHQGVESVLETMRASKINPDVTTFTVMMEGTLANDGTREPAEQVQIVNRIISEMNAAGIDANMMTYASMVQILLNEGNEKAVQAVLAHIWHNGMELSSHIYTMLVNYYFSRDPPDVEAVNNLIERRNLKQNRKIDRVFWERVIKGYSIHGEIHRAMDIYQNVVIPMGVTRITFDTLHEFLWGLQDIEAWDVAQEVVDHVSALPEDEFHEMMESRKHFPLTLREEALRAYRHRFWHLANRLGMLKGKAAEKFREAISFRTREY